MITLIASIKILYIVSLFITYIDKLINDLINNLIDVTLINKKSYYYI